LFYTVDIIFRFDFNDSIITLYSLFWTNFWYLPIFFFSLFFIFFYFFMGNYAPFSLIFLLIYFYEISDFWITNNLCCLFSTKFNNINFFLFNNINKYHPLVFYLSVLFLIYIVLSNSLIFLVNMKIRWQQQCFYSCLKKIYLITFVINITALYLGSWWAIQEGTWGGWWNWDSSETFGLIVCLIILYVIHTFYTIISLIFMFFYFVRTFFLFLLSYLIIQLNFELVSHNFGIKFFYFFNNIFFLTELFLMVIYFLVKFLIQQCLLFTQILFLTKLFKDLKKTNVYFFIGVLILVMFLLLFISFNSMFNYFVWTFLEINVTNNFKNNEISKINVYTLTIIFILITKNIQLKKIIFFLPLSIVIINYCWYLIIFTSWQLTLMFGVHWGFFIFILINLMAHNLQLSIYFIKTSNIVTFLSNWLFVLFSTTISIDCLFLEVTNFWFYFTNFWTDSFNLIFLPLRFISSNFFFTQSTLLFNNILYFKNTFNYLLVYIEIPYIYAMNIQLLISCMFFWLYFRISLKNWFY